MTENDAVQVEEIDTVSIVNGYMKWLLNAIPGDSYIYFEGPYLAIDSDERLRVLETYERGLVDLVQRRLTPISERGKFQYIAIRRHPKEWWNRPKFLRDRA